MLLTANACRLSCIYLALAGRVRAALNDGPAGKVFEEPPAAKEDVQRRRLDTVSIYGVDYDPATTTKLEFYSDTDVGPIPTEFGLLTSLTHLRVPPAFRRPPRRAARPCLGIVGEFLGMEMTRSPARSRPRSASSRR